MLNQSEQIGLALELMLQSEICATFPLAYIGEWIQPAIEHQQIMFLFDGLGGGDDTKAPLAFWTWAYLAEDSENRWRTDPQVTLHESEWSEGDRLWIIDFVARKGMVRSVINYINNHMFDGINTINSLRRLHDGSVRKVSQWQRRPPLERHSLYIRHPPSCFAASRTQFINMQENKTAQ